MNDPIISTCTCSELSGGAGLTGAKAAAPCGRVPWLRSCSPVHHTRLCILPPLDWFSRPPAAQSGRACRWWPGAICRDRHTRPPVAWTWTSESARSIVSPRHQGVPTLSWLCKAATNRSEQCAEEERGAEGPVWGGACLGIPVEDLTRKSGEADRPPGPIVLAATAAPIVRPGAAPHTPVM
jgi:hypothetical protein